MGDRFVSGFIAGFFAGIILNGMNFISFYILNYSKTSLL